MSHPHATMVTCKVTQATSRSGFLRCRQLHVSSHDAPTPNGGTAEAARIGGPSERLQALPDPCPYGLS